MQGIPMLTTGNTRHSPAPVQNNNVGAAEWLSFCPSLSPPTFTIGCPGSAFTTETYIVLVFLMGSGRERNMKGSNIFDNPLQWGQTSVDFSWPWNSRTTTLWFLRRYFIHVSSAISCTGEVWHVVTWHYNRSHDIIPYLVWSVVSFDCHVNVRLFSDKVEIFVEPIEKKCQELLGVMLSITHKLRCIATNLSLKAQNNY